MQRLTQIASVGARSAAVLVLLLGNPLPAPGAPAGPESTGAEPAEELRRKLQELERDLERLRADSGQERRLAEIERRIDALTRELERLRVGDAPVEASESAHGLGPAASKVYAVERGVSIGGYGEMLYESFADERDDGRPSGRRSQIDFLRAVLYTGYKFDDRFLFNSEVEFEHATTGAGDDELGEVSVEFAYLDWLWRPEASFRAGLVLVPMGLLNEQHEPTTYLGARRPVTESVILPSTWRENGFGLFGERGAASWRAYVVNGFDAAGFSARGLRGGRQKGSRALAEDWAFAGRFDYRPTLGALVGASLYHGDSGQGEELSVGTTLFSLHGELRARGFDARALWAGAWLDDVAELNAALELEGTASVGERLEGGYLQLGYDVFARSGRDASLVPYLRWEKVDTQAEVPDGFEKGRASEQEILTLGVAWKPHDQIVLKGDWQDVDNEAETAVDQLSVQLGYIF